jgi:hypothetical protein
MVLSQYGQCTNTKLIMVLGLLTKFGIYEGPFKDKIIYVVSKEGSHLNKKNIAKRNWQGRTTCEFCYKLESIHHNVIMLNFFGVPLL